MTTKEVPLEPTEEPMKAWKECRDYLFSLNNDHADKLGERLDKVIQAAAPSIAGKPDNGPDFNTEQNLHADTVAERYDAGKPHKELVERLKGWDSPHWAGVIPPELMDDLREAAAALDSATRESEKANEGDSAIVTSEHTAEHPASVAPRSSGRGRLTFDRATGTVKDSNGNVVLDRVEESNMI